MSLDFSHPNPQGAERGERPGLLRAEAGRRSARRVRASSPDRAHPQAAPLRDPKHQALPLGARGQRQEHRGSAGSSPTRDIARALQRPHVLPLRGSGKWAVLDASQILFRIAAELFDRHTSDRLAEADGHWKKILKSHSTTASSSRSACSVKETDGSTSAGGRARSFFKLRQDFKLSAGVRKQFRDYGETKQTVLQDLIKAISWTTSRKRSPRRGGPERAAAHRRRRPARQAAHRGPAAGRLRHQPERPPRAAAPRPLHRPDVRALQRRGAGRDPAERGGPLPRPRPQDGARHVEPGGRVHLVERPSASSTRSSRQRVDAGLIEPDAIRLAAIYAGGVLRDFFHLLREGVALAMYNEHEGPRRRGHALRDRGRAAPRLGGALRARLRGARPHPPHGRAAHCIEDADGYLALARVIECWNGKVLFDAMHPLLWFVSSASTRRESYVRARRRP